MKWGFNLERVKEERRKREEGKREGERNRRGRGTRKKNVNLMPWRQNILANNSWLLT